MLNVYGAFFAFGFFCAYSITRFLFSYCRGKGYRSVPSTDFLLFVLLVSGVMGGRGLFVLYNLPYFIEYPSEIPAVWHGGWVWHGALGGGLLALATYAKIKKISFLFLADILAPGVILAQSIGRWGNYFNQELYGLPTNLPWAIFIDEAYRVSGYEGYARFHPTFLYESLWDFILFIALFFFLKKYGKTYWSEGRFGFVFAWYLTAYSFGRFFIEFLRVDAVPVLLGLRTPQWLSILLILAGIYILLQRRKRVV